jgi:hypothetical protein
VRRAVSYRDAVVLLGGDPPALAALDRVLAGALSLGTGGLSDVALSVFDGQPRIVLLGRGLLPFAASDLQLTGREEIRLASGVPGSGAAVTAGDVLSAVLTAAPPQPTPDLPPERFTEILFQWYQGLSARLQAFTRGLALWDSLDDEQRTASIQALGSDLIDRAVRRYQELYAQLAVEVPEFRFWTGQAEHAATRAEVRRALAGVETLLAELAASAHGVGSPGADGAAALTAAYRAVLHRPILAEGETPTGVRLPTLEEGYLDPDFRVSAVGGDGHPANEDWWPGIPVRRDLTDYLAGALTSPEAAAAPLVVLGQPGAGKSVLTKILAARLPAAGFLPVRVVLREVAAEADIQDQVEHAIRSATGLRLDWPAVATAMPGATPVILLDGFDELLQATGVAQSDYLLKVAQFQQREADLGRPAVVIVTTRTAVADRAATRTEPSLSA